LTFPSRELLDSVIQTMAQPGAVCELAKTCVCGLSINSRCNGRYQAVLFQREIGNEVVKLKHKSYFMPEKTQRAATPVKFFTVYGHPATVRFVESPKQVEKGAFAATRRTAERDGLAFEHLEIYAIENVNRTCIVALPHLFRSQKNAGSSLCL
jgi:hypothetical protein